MSLELLGAFYCGGRTAAAICLLEGRPVSFDTVTAYHKALSAASEYRRRVKQAIQKLERHYLGGRKVRVAVYTDGSAGKHMEF